MVCVTESREVEQIVKDVIMKDRLPIRLDRYYSTKELARLFRVNESTIKRWADSGKIDCFKTPGGHRRYPPERVLEFISRYNYEIIPDDFQILSGV